MALIDSEGFGFSTTFADYLNYGLYNNPASSPGQPSIGTGGPLGDNYMNAGVAGTTNTAIVRVLPSAPTTFFWGGRIAVGAGARSTDLVFYDGGGEQFHVNFNTSNGAVAVIRNATQLGITGPGIVPLAGLTLNWCYVEVGATINGSTGSVTVKVNGTTVLALTNVNNKNSGTATVTSWSAGAGDLCSAFSLAHHYFCDNSGSAPWNTYLGDVRVQTLLPVSDGTVQFSPNGLGSAHANAALVPPNPGTDFNSDSTVGHQDIFNTGTIAASLNTVFGVHVKSLLGKSNSGNRSAETVLKSGATTSTGTGTGLSTTPAQLRTMYQTDPNTSAQWTASNVNAAQPGYKVSA